MANIVVLIMAYIALSACSEVQLPQGILDCLQSLEDNLARITELNNGCKVNFNNEVQPEEFQQCVQEKMKSDTKLSPTLELCSQEIQGKLSDEQLKEAYGRLAKIFGHLEVE